MQHLNRLLKSKAPKDRIVLLESLFKEISVEVDRIMAFGPCNKPLTEDAANVFFSNKRGFFKAQYNEEEKAVLPAVIANHLMLNQNKDSDADAYAAYQEKLLRAYLYATGTCESFSILGAYLLALKYEVDLSIETIITQGAHTYIRLHTKPEFIFDFWSPTFGEYKDSISWNESVDYTYRRCPDSEYKTEIVLNQDDLQRMGRNVFNLENKEMREEISLKVKEYTRQALRLVEDTRNETPERGASWS